MSLTKEQKSEIIGNYRIHENDTGSAEVQIAVLTKRIENLTQHLREHKSDESSRRGLLKLVGQRRKLLAYLRKRNFSRYMTLTDQLSLRRK